MCAGAIGTCTMPTHIHKGPSRYDEYYYIDRPQRTPAGRYIPKSNAKVGNWRDLASVNKSSDVDCR